jgi:drug/metabolite transporter (DMT)-like permease
MTAAPAERRMLALGLRLVSVFAFCGLNVLVKRLGEHDVSLPEILFWRQAFALPVVVAWVWMGPGLASIRTVRLPVHARRTLFGLLTMVCNFGSLQLLPLAEQTSIGFSFPLFATLLAALVLGEPVGWQRWSAVLIGFVGVLVVVQPGGNALSLDGSALALTAALLVAFVSLQIRDLAQTELPTTIVFWFSLLSVPVLALLLPWWMTAHDATTWALLFGLGTLGGLGQIAMTASLRLAPVSTVVGMDYSGIIWATLFGWLFWDHLPPSSTWIGAPVIIACAMFIAWREHRLALARSGVTV